MSFNMVRLRPTRKTVKQLFAKCRNMCAYPACKVKMVEDHGLVNAEICHIEAANEDGPRYNHESNDEYRRSYENLLLLCANHHNKIDGDPEAFSVQHLKKMKRDHEVSFKPNSEIEVGDAIAEEVLDKMTNYISGQAVIVEGDVEGDVIMVNQEKSDNPNELENSTKSKWRSALTDASLILGLILTIITLFEVCHERTDNEIDNGIQSIDYVIEKSGKYKMADEGLSEHHFFLSPGEDVTRVKKVIVWENPNIVALQMTWELLDGSTIVGTRYGGVGGTRGEFQIDPSERECKLNSV